MEGLGIVSIVAIALYSVSLLHLIYRSNEYKIIIAQAKSTLKYNFLVYIIMAIYVIIGPPLSFIVHLFSKSTLNQEEEYDV